MEDAVMKNIFAIISLGLILTAVSCTKEEQQLVTKGIGNVTVDMNVNGMTRAVTDDELRNSALVNIYKADFTGLVRSYVYSQMPSTMHLVADAYRVDVIAGEAVKAKPAAANWTEKSYMGSKEFTIVAGQNQSVQVEAKINNAVTAISFDPTVAENFNAGYTFTVNVDGDENRQLVYDAAKSGAEGYFIIDGLVEPSFTWTFTGTLTKDGSTLTKTGKIEGIEVGKVYKMNLKYTIKDGDLVFSLVVDYTTDIVDDTIVFEPVSTGLKVPLQPKAEIWAAHATVYADVDPKENEGATVQFAYSADGGTTWTYVDGVNYDEGVWKAELKGLTPATEYTYALVINGEHFGGTLTFKTEAAPALPNSSFEYVSKVAGESYYKFYDPNCGVSDATYMFWGSGNGEGSEGVEGSASMGIVITEIDTSDKKDGNQSVLCKNNSIVGMLTAGNLFTGQFAGLVGTSGGKVNFGRPWTSRPTALKIWCKYSTGKINILKNKNLGVTENDYDRAQIKVAVGTWSYKKYGGTKDSPILVNTTDESTFVDFFTDENTVANGDLIIYNDGYMINRGEKVTATTTEWIEYIIPLDYRQLAVEPTHIVISCATSQFGDYFTGYDKGELRIDAAELIYE
jgi:hypothetical protein